MINSKEIKSIVTGEWSGDDCEWFGTEFYYHDDLIGWHTQLNGVEVDGEYEDCIIIDGKEEKNLDDYISQAYSEEKENEYYAKRAAEIKTDNIAEEFSSAYAIVFYGDFSNRGEWIAFETEKEYDDWYYNHSDDKVSYYSGTKDKKFQKAYFSDMLRKEKSGFYNLTSDIDCVTEIEWN
jgi:hypothetical protein